MPMKLSTRPIKPGIIVFEIAGRVSMGDDCALLDSEVERHIQNSENRVIFDLVAVNHVDSAVIGQIVKCLTRLKRSGGGLRLCGVHGMVEGVLKMTQLYQVLAIFPTAAEAAENFALQAQS
ncbi:MAG: STAS domain-containing protein [Candidatus Acidiferrales bacterium]